MRRVYGVYVYGNHITICRCVPFTLNCKTSVMFCDLCVTFIYLSILGNSSVRRVFHQGDNDVFWLDIRHGNDRNQRPAAVPFEFLRFAQPVQAGEKSQVNSFYHWPIVKEHIFMNSYIFTVVVNKEEFRSLWLLCTIRNF